MPNNNARRDYDRDGVARPLTDREIRSLDIEYLSRQRPWKADELERVRDAARALVRTHIECDGRATFDGRALWSLLAALDRSGEGRSGKAAT